MAETPQWRLVGDWFDVCKCTIPCPCTFAQAPSEGDCEGILAWHIKEGSFGDVTLDDLNVVALGAFTGNVWADEGKVSMGIFIDERADDSQRAGLQTISPTGARRFRARSRHAPRRSRAQRRQRASASRFTTRRAPRSVPVRPPLGASRPPTERKASGSNGNGTAARASTSRSTGAARTTDE